MSREFRVLGLDPGWANIGYAIVNLVPFTPVRMGLIQTKKSDKKLKVLSSDDNVRRGREIVASLDALLAENTIHAICMESKSFPRNASASAKVAMFWGIIIKLATILDVPLIQARPQEIKRRMCAKEKATKQDVQDACDLMFGKELVHGLVEGIARSKLEHPYDGLATVVACSDGETLRLARRMAEG